MVLIYFLVALLSTICGSMAGLGGGVIIKPVYWSFISMYYFFYGISFGNQTIIL